MSTQIENSILAERPKVGEHDSPTRWVFFDADCPFCLRLVRKFERPLTRRGFAFAPLQTDWARAHFGLIPSEPLTEMKVITADGRDLGGGDAVAYLAGEIWWTAAISALAAMPFGMLLIRRAYKWVAENRACPNGACALQPPQRQSRSFAALLPLLTLPVCIVAMKSVLPPWAFMWAFAFAIFAGCKWATWWPNRRTRASSLRHAGYLLAWPGMDAAAFLDSTIKPASPSRREWAWAALKSIIGTTLIWGCVRVISPSFPVLRGWTGLLGLVFLLHFGTFHLLALAWKRCGVQAEPLMRTPALSASLAEFWGARWNTGFHQLAVSLIFAPMRRRVGAKGAVLAVFLISGLVHDLVISFPAGGGFGLPTGYFLVQAAGLFLERSSFGTTLGLGQGRPGWIFTMVVAGVPAYGLFHPWFVMRVVLPFLKVIGAF